MVAEADKSLGALAQLVFGPDAGQEVGIEENDVLQGIGFLVGDGVDVTFLAVDAGSDGRGQREAGLEIKPRSGAISLVNSFTVRGNSR